MPRGNINEYTDSIQRYSDYTKGIGAGRENLLKTKRNEYGYQEKLDALNNADRQVLETEKLLRDLPKNVQARTNGRLVNNAQLARITANEQDPLTRQLGDVARNRDVSTQAIGRIERLLSEDTANYDKDVEAMLRALGAESESKWNKFNALEDSYWKQQEANFQADIKRIEQENADRLMRLLNQPPVLPPAPSQNTPNNNPTNEQNKKGVAESFKNTGTLSVNSNPIYKNGVLSPEFMGVTPNYASYTGNIGLNKTSLPATNLIGDSMNGFTNTNTNSSNWGNDVKAGKIDTKKNKGLNLDFIRNLFR